MAGGAQESVNIWGVHAVSTRPTRYSTTPKEDAFEAVRGFRRGGRIIGVTKGQFSLLDILRALLDCTGPAEVLVAAWTSGIRDAETAAWLLQEGRITRMRWLVDRSFLTRKPEYAEQIREMFGQEALLESNNHAKVLLIGNDDWRVVVRSSMNLNRNARFEQFDIDDNAEIYEFFDRVFNELLLHEAVGLGRPGSEVQAAFGAVQWDWNRLRRDEYLPPAMDEWERSSDD